MMGLPVMIVHRWRLIVIGAAFGIEGFVHADDRSAKTAHQMFDHMVKTDAKPLAHQLRGDMPVAQMPGDAG